MKTETKVLTVMLADRNESYSIRQLAMRSGAGYKIVHTAVQMLYKKGVLEKKPFGGSIAISLSGKFSPAIATAELDRRTALLKHSNFSAIYEKLAGLKFPLMALVFGSYAKGAARKDSDMDLLVVCTKGHESAVNDVLGILPLKIHLVVLSYEDFLSMEKSKEFTVVSEAIKSNVILIGIEDFYRLVGHA